MLHSRHSIVALDGLPVMMVAELFDSTNERRDTISMIAFPNPASDARLCVWRGGMTWRANEADGQQPADALSV